MTAAAVDLPTQLPQADEVPPLVSVIVRSLDRASLNEALASVSAQNWPAIEVLIVAALPGHSALAPQAPSLAEGQTSFRLLPTDQPRPRSRAANAGLDAARGRYVIFLDDDDWFMPGHLARLVHVLRDHPGALAAYTGVALVDAEHRPLGQAFDMPFDTVRQLAGNLTPIHAVLFDAALIERGCRFDESLDQYEDWDFWLQLSRHTVFVHLPGVSAVYRIHASSGVHDDPGPQGLSSARIYAKWKPQWTDEQIGDLMHRVWSHAELELQLDTAERGRQQAQRALDAALAGFAATEVRIDALEAVVRQQHAQALVAGEQLLAIGRETRVRVDAAHVRFNELVTVVNARIDHVLDVAAQHRAQQAQQSQQLQSVQAAQLANVQTRLSRQETHAQQQLVALQAVADQLTRGTTWQREEATRLTEGLALAESQVQALQMQRHLILASTSWRITSPLRSAATLLKRLLGRASNP